MANIKVILVNAAQEDDAFQAPTRFSVSNGIWFLASYLLEKGYYTRIIDETTRKGGLHKHTLVHRTIKLATKSGEVDKVYETPVGATFQEVVRQRAADFERLTSHEFVAKHGAFRIPGEINRTIVRTGNPIEDTLIEIDHELASGDALVVGIPLRATANYLPATQLGKAIKDSFGSHVKVIYGGQHITAMAEEFLRDNPWVDVAVCGHSISTIEEALQRALDDSSDKIVWRLDHNGQKQREEDITTYPLLDPSLLEENEYPLRPNHTFNTEGRKWVDWQISMGCPLMCSFCAVSMTPKGEKQYSMIPLDKLERQLLRFKEAKISELVLQDDAILSNRFLPAAVRLFKKHGFFWQNNGGIQYEKLTQAHVDQWCEYNQSGEGRITALYVPFNPRNWNKGKSAGETQTVRYPHLLALLKQLRDAGVYVFSSEIVAQPTEPRSEAERDTALYVDLVQRGYLNAALTFSNTFLPGTEDYGMYKDWIVSKIDYAGYNLFTTHHRTKYIEDPSEIERWVVERNKTLNKVQGSFAWGTAFPNVGPMAGE